MSEDSIASDFISCRNEANAPLLPPRKRLLAGLKQNGWPSPSSSSCAPAAPEPPQSKETLAHPSSTKAEGLDHNSGDAADGGSLQSLSDSGSPQSFNDGAESLDSQSKGLQKPKRQIAPSPRTMKEISNKKKKKKSATPDGEENLLNGVVDDAKPSLIVNKSKLSVASKISIVAEEHSVASKISIEAEEHSVALLEGEIPVEEDEERVTSANGDASAGHAMNVKLGSNPVSVDKEEEQATCEKAPNRSKNSARKTKMNSKPLARPDNTKKHRKVSNRQKLNKEKEAERKKLEMQSEKAARIPLPLADEEIARQLHRAMNSSPRIARCLSPKEDGPFLASSQKRFSGS